MGESTLARQVAAMADPQRLQLLALLLTDPDGEADTSRLAGPGGDTDLVRVHLEAMAAVGLLGRDSRRSGPVRYRPTHDALVRFGSLAFGGAGPHEHVDRSEHGPILERITERLSVTFAGTFARETVARYVEESYSLLASRARVRQHLPALTSRFATDRLTALARAQGVSLHTTTDVLFVCVRNSGRSQIAACILRSLAGPGVRVRTAGSAPVARIDPAVVKVLIERGWEQIAEFPKPLTDDVVRASDYVVTMGCGDACPLVPGRRYLDWPVADPTGLEEAEIRVIVDEIEHRVRLLLTEIIP